MTAIHIYDLPDDLGEYNDALHAQEAIAALHETYELLRRHRKYRDLDGDGVTGAQLIDELWDEFFEIAGSVLEATE